MNKAKSTIDSKVSSQKIKGKYYYLLRLYSSLINSQKAVVTLLGICVFFDILISDEEPPDDCEVKLSHRKKSYLQIYTNSTEERKKAIKAIQDSNFETASDDMWSFHHKVTRENGIQLSE
ncbi:4926_t:CDS:2 [Funneliformis geosporum]|uniref:4926_t:CDS:1 n=1 Tax=Funneliformis geosporum TaxID=1117311 RepID=A0A9W4SXL1_9GLOM|nr:4926_t:CDS:2 [Funneliformis geosporum]